MLRLKTKSRLLVKGFSQETGIDNHKTTGPTPPVAAVKMKVAVVNEMGFPLFHLEVSQALVQAPLKGIIMQL